MIGWAAATGDVGLEPLILFLIILLWMPPHFWALSLNRAGEYARAGVPMLPVVAGKATTKRQILMYSVLLFLVFLLPWVLGLAGMAYGAITAICGAMFVVLAFRLRSSSNDDRRGASRLFVFSIFYLFLLFAALLADHSADRWSSTSSAPIARTALQSVQRLYLSRTVRTGRSSTNIEAGEV